MTNFTESDHPRAADGVFTDKPQSAAEIALPTKPVIATAARDVELNRHTTPLPPYPADLLAPVVTFNTGDSTNYLYLHSHIGEGRDQVSVTVWVDEYGDRADSINDGSESTGWDANTDAEFLDWAHAVRERASFDYHAAILQLVDGHVEDAIVTNALS
jgi:hypothetical protein